MLYLYKTKFLFKEYYLNFFFLLAKLNKNEKNADYKHIVQLYIKYIV